ncbi:Prefoldin [Clavulina sp. PMI_390]|nr:Prefoldin [Clavulina sp. PMI_390]
MQALETRIQAASSEYQKLQDELTHIVGVRQNLDAQLTETTEVKKEFEKLKPENTVYKLIGPGLMPQDQDEAKQNVAKRLEFINSEIGRNERKIKELQDKAEAKKNEIVEIQNAAAALQQQGGEGAAPPKIAA